MKKKNDVYYVLFVENSTPTLKKFKTKKAAKKFVENFKSLSRGESDGDWVDLFFRGKIYETDRQFEDAV